MYLHTLLLIKNTYPDPASNQEPFNHQSNALPTKVSRQVAISYINTYEMICYFEIMCKLEIPWWTWSKEDPNEKLSLSKNLFHCLENKKLSNEQNFIASAKKPAFYLHHKCTCCDFNTGVHFWQKAYWEMQFGER